MGYFALSEMEAINVGGLGMERDLHFTPKPLSAVKKEHQEWQPSTNGLVLVA